MTEKVRYTTTMRVLGCVERFDKLYVGGTGAEAQFMERSKGWFVSTDAGLFHFGDQEPHELKRGVVLKVTFEVQ